MGLLYVMPISLKEKDRIELIQSNTSKKIILKSYGLPLIFWASYFTLLLVVAIMGITIYGPLSKVIYSQDLLNQFIGLLTTSILIATPFAGAFFLLFEKLTDDIFRAQ